MEQLRMKRELKLRDFEVFKIREGFFGKEICYMLIMDYRRPSQLSDFPHLKEVENEKDFGRKNLIKVVFISDTILSKELAQEVIYLAQGLSEIDGNCDWTCDFETIDAKLFEKLLYKKEDMLMYLETLLNKNGFQVSLSNILPEQFDYLSQD